MKSCIVRTTGIAATALLLGATAPLDVAAQPRPVDHVSVRAEMTIDDMGRRVARDGWTVRHDGPWLNANDQWTHQVGVSFFPANSEYWIAVVVEECGACAFEVRFFDEAAGGYFPLNSVLDLASAGGMTTATGRFAVERDTRGELYVQMIDDARLYPTYVILAQIR